MPRFTKMAIFSLFISLASAFIFTSATKAQSTPTWAFEETFDGDPSSPS